MTPARLALENGSVFRGDAFGAIDAPVTSSGEVVFNTAMTGYQEALTDPSYAGQILCMTAPLIGNYGVAPTEDMESSKLQVAGFVVRELSRRHSNFRAGTDVGAWLAEAGLPGISGIDTRALVRQVREQGALRGVISTDPSLSDDELVARARGGVEMTGRNLAETVSPDAAYDWTEPLGVWGPPALAAPGDTPRRVVALDCGAKRNMYRHLVERGCTVHAVPWNATPADLDGFAPDGVLVSNGPGDPAAVDATIALLRHVLDRGWPTLGICLGYQLLALALGAGTYKLKFGHRGANQPVRNCLTGRVEITSQNHGFCVDPASLDALDCETTHLHLNDDTVAGFRHRSKPVFGVQYHPEASPGPHDSAYLFDCFVEMIRTGTPITADQVQRIQAAACDVPMV